MQTDGVIFGGVGSGLYGMLVFALVAVFVAGLMIGRTPEYLGKKVEAFEIKMAMVVALVLGASILGFTALATALPEGQAGPLNAGPHGHRRHPRPRPDRRARRRARPHQCPGVRA